MFTTTIIPTIGRESLAQSVQSVLEQDFSEEDFEVVVVNDSGKPLSYAPWQESKRVRIINTQRRERCFARNAGASIAKGHYFHFLDDDDWLLPGALDVWWQLAQKKAAVWIYSGTRYIGPSGDLLAEFSKEHRGNCFLQVIAGEWIPIQSALIRSDSFFEVGGFDPKYIVGEDKDICRKIAFQWDFISSTIPVVCLLRDRENSSSKMELSTYCDVMSRNENLSLNGAFSRMHSSSNEAYWKGKIVRAYLTCVCWNFKQKKYASAIGKGLVAAISLAFVCKNLIYVKFWTAILKPHVLKNVY